MAGDSDFLLRIVADLDECRRFHIEHLSSIKVRDTYGENQALARDSRPRVVCSRNEAALHRHQFEQCSLWSATFVAILLLTPRAVTAPARRNAREPKMKLNVDRFAGWDKLSGFCKRRRSQMASVAYPRTMRGAWHSRSCGCRSSSGSPAALIQARRD
jgi:hypothetical protein